MAAERLNQSVLGMKKIIDGHLPYEVDMMRDAHIRLANGIEDSNVKNAYIEVFCIHARNLIDFFTGRSRNKHE